MEEYLKQLNQDIKDIFNYQIETTKAYVVPTRNDVNLTYPIGNDKKGKLIETCVLMIDIRNSTKISRQLNKDKVKLGKIYSAFIYAMTNIANEYGYVRNIVGDRVMVVFEPENCFENAINCAAVMYTVANKILMPLTGLSEFKIGIGIDFGEMLVLKTGIQKKFHEQSEYKGLVWVGDTANTASKLCDFANIEYSAPNFKLTIEDIRYDYEKLFNGYIPSYGLTKKNTSSRLIKEDITKNLDHIEFSKNIKVNVTGGMEYNGKNVKNFSIENRTGTTVPILISWKVYSEYKKINNSHYLPMLSKREYPNSPYASNGIYGGYFFLKDFNKMKI